MLSQILNPSKVTHHHPALAQPLSPTDDDETAVKLVVEPKDRRANVQRGLSSVFVPSPDSCSSAADRRKRLIAGSRHIRVV